MATINTTSITINAGIHRGENTHHQDIVIAPVNLSTININVNTSSIGEWSGVALRISDLDGLYTVYLLCYVGYEITYSFHYC